MHIDIVYSRARLSDGGHISGSGPFVERDADVLRGMGHDVHTILWTRTVHAWSVLKCSFRHRWASDHVVIFWLGGGASYLWNLLPRRLRGMTVLIVGGSEVSDLSGYGQLGTTMEGAIRGSFLRSDALVFVAPHLLRTAIGHGLPLPRFLHVSPGFVDSQRFAPGTKVHRTAAMVGPYTSQNRVLVKGVDRFMDLAYSNPSWKFTLVGVHGIQLPLTPENVHILPPVSEEYVEAILASSEVILCLSRTEGSPNSLVEGMLSGCIPVVSTDPPALPPMVEGVGRAISDFTIDLDDVTLEFSGADARAKAMKASSRQQRELMWRRILHNFFPYEVSP